MCKHYIELQSHRQLFRPCAHSQGQRCNIKAVDNFIRFYKEMYRGSKFFSNYKILGKDLSIYLTGNILYDIKAFDFYQT